MRRGEKAWESHNTLFVEPNVLSDSQKGVEERASNGGQWPIVLTFPTIRLHFSPLNPMLAWQFHSPGKSQPNHHLNQVIAHIDLRPAQSMSGRCGTGVMGVVPAFAEGEDTEYHVVTALIIAPVGPQTPKMASRVHAPRNMVNKEDSHQPSPDESCPDTQPASFNQSADHRWNREAEDDLERGEHVYNP